MSRLRSAAAALGCTLLAGCYSLVEIDPSTVRPPERVRANVSVAGAVRVAEVLGSPRRALDGQLVERTPDGFYILLPTAVVQSGAGLQALNQRLLVLHEDLVSLQRRELDRTRTGLVALAGAGLVGTVLAVSLAGRSGSSRTGEPGDGPADARIPFLRIPLSLPIR